ncbi:tes-1 [Pristionchus pacificus]|uniref:Tes-1 n=1 Tax=Pristionchus pacificus TaxID=54126 RepID=A0A2A6BE72_PRIPA|nr:tes-1 [Pristionchus pacificus]|eukprot:PDM64195.1 tes-1 [Pristionchus pacificus]
MDSLEDPPSLVNPRIFQLEVKPKPVLSHEIGAGSKCNKCNCPGLDLHYWRKRCKNCSCNLQDHDVVLEADHAQIVIGRLFGAREIFEGRLTSATPSSIVTSHSLHEPSYAVPFAADNNSARKAPTAAYNVSVESYAPESQNNKIVQKEDKLKKPSNSATTEYAWVPMENAQMVEKYMESLPVEERPVTGSQGEKNRKQRLAQQLPLFDFDINNQKINDEIEKESLAKFIDNVRSNVVGVGEVVEVDRDGFLDRATRNMTMNGDNGEMNEDGQKTILPTDCKTCSGRLDQGDVGVTTSHGHKDDAWHPKCFRCCVCNELLADLIYFYHKGDYYCGRHFAEKQYPRCSGCDELIFAKEYTLAEGKSWHFEHFACDKCDLRLGGHRYITKDEQPHCLECYLKHYAKVDMQHLSQCENCEKNLIGEKFLLKEKTLFCSAKCKNEHTQKN